MSPPQDPSEEKAGTGATVEGRNPSARGAHSSAGGNPPQVSELSWSFLVACDGYDVISFSNEFIRFDNELINFINELINNFDCPLPRILLRRKLGPVPLEESRGVTLALEVRMEQTLRTPPGVVSHCARFTLCKMSVTLTPPQQATRSSSGRRKSASCIISRICCWRLCSWHSPQVPAGPFPLCRMD